MRELDPELGGDGPPVVVRVAEHAAALVIEGDRVAQGLPRRMPSSIASDIHSPASTST
jgi:hypothetical protein